MNRFILFAFATAATTQAFAADCTVPVFKEPPKIENNRFISKLTGECRLAVRASDVRPVEKFFNDTLFDDVERRIEGPVSDQTLGIPGNRYDLVYRRPEGTIRMIVKLASDGRDLVVSDSQSKEVNFSGVGKYFKKIDNNIRVERGADGVFQLKFDNAIQIEKPRLAPAEVFIQIASEQSVKQYNVERERLVKALEAAID
jgi:hypothetical protein